jgi:pimeloyl-ACP methyl ester carboxylesterase
MHDDDLTLKVLRVGAQPYGDDAGAFRLMIETSRGSIEAIFHAVEGGSGAAIFVGGAMGGIDGPADRLYSRLPDMLRDHEISSLRIEYRMPNNLEECVLDVLAGCSFLKGIGASDAVVIGHSFGGAVVVRAGELHPMIRGVVSMSPQLFGTQTVENLDVPLLLVHGMSDNVLSHEASEDIYRRAKEPKRMVLYAEAGHSLIQVKDEVADLLLDWIPATLEGREPSTSAGQAQPPDAPDDKTDSTD